MEYFEELNGLFEGKSAELFKPKPKKHLTTPDDRLIDSFNEITQFVELHGHTPDANVEDMKEASLGHRLNSMRIDSEKVKKLSEYDELGLLQLNEAPKSLDELFADDSGLFNNPTNIFNIGELPNRGERAESDFIAKRKAAKDFNSYKDSFKKLQQELADGTKKLVRFEKVSQLDANNYYVADNIMCYVEKIGEAKEVYGRRKERLRVIFENGTESNMYLRSLSSQLYKDGYIVVDAARQDQVDDSKAVGRIYILRSLSDDPRISTIKDLYKIGVTSGPVAERIKNAVNDPTYLMSPVDVVEDYRLTGDYVPHKVESMIQGVFESARIDLEITDKYGRKYVPSEWYSAPLDQIQLAVDLINSGDIKDYHYDSMTQVLKLHNK